MPIFRPKSDPESIECLQTFCVCRSSVDDESAYFVTSVHVWKLACSGVGRLEIADVPLALLVDYFRQKLDF